MNTRNYNDGKQAAGLQTEPDISLVREMFGDETANRLEIRKHSGCMYKFAAVDREVVAWLEGYGDQIAQNQADVQNAESDWFLNHPSA